MKEFLVVVDMQKDFVDGSLGTKEAESIIPNVVKKISNFRGDIFVTFDTHFDNYMDTAEGKKLPVPHCIKGTEGWELDIRVGKALTNKEFTKVEKRTFGSVELPELIKTAASDEAFEITLIGLCTDICVVSNALILKANFPEMKIAVDASCCAGVTVSSHEEALNTMSMCQIEILNS